MIPTESQAKQLWEKYHLPEKKRIHVALVARVALFLAAECEKNIPGCHINIPLLKAAAYLHDIDKVIPRRSGEQHPAWPVHTTTTTIGPSCRQATLSARRNRTASRQQTSAQTRNHPAFGRIKTYRFHACRERRAVFS